MNDLASYRARIREIAPELVFNSVVLNREGLLNDVVIVNDRLVFRFAKRDFGFKNLQEEANILRFLRSYISLQIPEPFYSSDDVLAYQLIQGKALRRDILSGLSDDEQQAIADQLAQFLKELHSVPVSESHDFALPMADALMKYESWIGVYQRIREKVFPLLQPHQTEWATGHFESHLADRNNFEYEYKMVDTDIPPYHIMFDSRKRRINGVIDFGCAGLGDPAIDFGVIIYHYGETFIDRFYRTYPEAEAYVRRARFYAGAHELRWILNGIERNDLWWYGVHIGSAKDMRYG